MKSSTLILTVIAATAVVLLANMYKDTQELQDLDCGLTTHFETFLSNHGYGNFDFNRKDIRCGAWGGKDSDSTPIKNTPVIFVHGNSDVAFGRGTQDGYKVWQTGFRSLAGFLVGKGYTKAELYTTTWGNANDSNATNVYHAKEVVLRMRKFV